jgi:hypothetical protein
MVGQLAATPRGHLQHVRTFGAQAAVSSQGAVSRGASGLYPCCGGQAQGAQTADHGAAVILGRCHWRHCLGPCWGLQVGRCILISAKSNAQDDTGNSVTRLCHAASLNRRSSGEFKSITQAKTVQAASAAIGLDLLQLRQEALLGVGQRLAAGSRE